MKKIIILTLIILSLSSFAYARVSFDMKLSAPFNTVEDRDSYSELSKRFMDGFGAYRNRGHLHSAQDIKGDYGEAVYPVYDGVVVDIWGKFPYKTLAIMHTDNNRRVFYTSSVHLGEAYVEAGDYVTKNTKIGRLLTREEQKRAYYSKVHLHLEFRKSIINKRVSAKCYTIEQLLVYFYDPQPIFKKHMN